MVKMLLRVPLPFGVTAPPQLSVCPLASLRHHIFPYVASVTIDCPWRPCVLPPVLPHLRPYFRTSVHPHLRTSAPPPISTSALPHLRSSALSGWSCAAHRRRSRPKAQIRNQKPKSKIQNPNPKSKTQFQNPKCASPRRASRASAVQPLIGVRRVLLIKLFN